MNVVAVSKRYNLVRTELDVNVYVISVNIFSAFGIR